MISSRMIAVTIVISLSRCLQADKRFFTLLKKEFTWMEVSDNPEREVYSREAISLLRLYRK